jgi:hypothetical protein
VLEDQDYHLTGLNTHPRVFRRIIVGPFDQFPIRDVEIGLVRVLKRDSHPVRFVFVKVPQDIGKSCHYFFLD